MLKRFKELISKNPEEKNEEERIDDVNYACAALLIETAYADKNFKDDEILSLKQTLKKLFSFDESTIKEIIDDAYKTVSNSTSLYEHTKIINERFNYPNKLSLINGLWKVAYFDNKLDKYEEHIIRKIASLIHVSHGDFIKEKIKVKNKT